MNARDAARICETVDRLQAGTATKVDAELLETIGEGLPSVVAFPLFEAARSIHEGDTLQALAYLNDMEIRHVQSPS